MRTDRGSDFNRSFIGTRKRLKSNNRRYIIKENIFVDVALIKEVFDKNTLFYISNNKTDFRNCRMKLNDRRKFCDNDVLFITKLLCRIFSIDLNYGTLRKLGFLPSSSGK